MAGYHDSEDDEQWAPVSDLMAVLMLMFMLIVVAHIHAVIASKSEDPIEITEPTELIESTELIEPVKPTEITEAIQTIYGFYRAFLWVEPTEITEAIQTHAEIFQAECDKIYYALLDEFRDDFAKWQATLFPNLAIRFEDPNILFPDAEAEPKPEFKALLADFFPRYMRKISIYGDDIKEIRIEGHTSSKWETATNRNEAYMKNMELSQDRARAILRYVMFEVTEATEYNQWARPLVTANGLSSSKWIPFANGIGENETASRRVEFRLLVKSCLKAE